MSGAGKCVLGIIMIIIFFITLTTESIPVIWTGAGLVGAYFIYSGIREMVSGKQYQCKTCGFRGSQRDVLAHALQSHPEQFSDTEKQKLSVYLGVPVPTTPTIEESPPTDVEDSEPVEIQ